MKIKRIPFEPDMGRPLRIFMSAGGLQIQDMADRLGLSKAYITHLRSNYYTPSPRVVAKLSKAIGLSQWAYAALCLHTLDGIPETTRREIADEVLEALIRYTLPPVPANCKGQGIGESPSAARGRRRRRRSHEANRVAYGKEEDGCYRNASMRVFCSDPKMEAEAVALALEFAPWLAPQKSKRKVKSEKGKVHAGVVRGRRAGRKRVR